MSGASPSRDLPAAAPDPTARVAAPPGLLRIHEDAAERALTPRFIRDLRDDAGCSLAEIGLLLEDEEARIRDRERFRTAAHTAEKRTILRDLIARTDRQVRTLGDSVYTTIFAGSTPVGALIAGALASGLGSAAALGIGGLGTVIVGAAAILWMRRHRAMVAYQGPQPVPVVLASVTVPLGRGEPRA